MKLIISLLVYNQLEITKKCIQSILEKSTSDYLLIISDNASGNETAKWLKTFCAFHQFNTVYIRNEENLGYIGAHNKAYEYTKDFDADYFCVLNNDLVIETHGWDSRFISYLENTQGLAQIGNKQDFGFLDREGIGRPNMGRPIDYIGGSCFIVDRKAVDDVGGLFEDKYMTFAFCEDADLSLRLRNKGYKIGECHKTIIHHFHNQSFKNEKVDVDFKSIEKQNRKFLIDRWRKYLRVRNFDSMRILVIREGAIGDTFLITPIISELKNKYPKSIIDVQTQCGSILINNPDITEIGRNMKQRYQYDLIIDLDMSYEENPKMHIIDAYAEKANVILDPDKCIPKYYGLPETKSYNLKNTIIMNSDGSWESRTWPLDRWKKFGEYLAERYNVIEVGINPNAYLGVGENLIGKLTLHQTIELISRSEMLVAFDGLLAHVAQSLNIPVFLIFGCTNPEYRIHNWRISTVVFRGKDELPCSGCHHEGEAKVFTKCKQKETYCLTGISLERVIETFEFRKDFKNV